MLLKVDHISVFVGFAAFELRKGVSNVLPSLPQRYVVGLSRITGRLPIDTELQDKGFVLGECDRQVIELKHSFRPTVLVERPSLVAGLVRFLKQIVLVLFTVANNQKTERFLRYVFQVYAHPICLIINNCNGCGVHNPRLKESKSGNKTVRKLNLFRKLYTDYSTALPAGVF